MVIGLFNFRKKMSKSQIILDEMVNDFTDSISENFLGIPLRKKKELLVPIRENIYLKFWIKMLKQFIDFTV